MAALDAVSAWLAPGRQRRVVKVPDFRGLHVSETFLIALQAGVKVEIVRLARHPAPVDGLVVKQDPLPGTRVKRDSRVDLIVRHPEDLTSSGQP
jgi:beta-lactam-binding protein with PASTA domain